MYAMDSITAKKDPIFYLKLQLRASLYGILDLIAKMLTY